MNLSEIQITAIALGSVAIVALILTLRRRRVATVLPQPTRTFQPCAVVYVDIEEIGRASERLDLEIVTDNFITIWQELAQIAQDFGGAVTEGGSHGFFVVFPRAQNTDLSCVDRAILACRAMAAMATQKTLLSNTGFHPIRLGMDFHQTIAGTVSLASGWQNYALGEGLNNAKFIAQKSNLFETLLSENAKSDLSPRSFSLIELRQRYIDKPFTDGKMHVFEVVEDENLQQIEQARLRIREIIGAGRQEIRWEVPSELHFPMRIGADEGRLINFSVGGVGILVDFPLIVGRNLKLALGTETTPLGIKFKTETATHIACTVTWVKKVSEELSHVGLKFTNLSPFAGRIVVLEIKNFILAHNPQQRIQVAS